MNLPPLSLRGKLFAFATLLILVPGVLLGFLADRSARDTLQTVIGRELAREALHTADRLSVFLRAEHETLASFARQDLMREVRVGDIDKRIAQALATLREGNAARADYLVLGPARSVIAASSPRWLEDSRRHSAADLLDESSAYTGPFETDDGRRLLAVARSIPDPDGGTGDLGILVALLDWSHVEQMLAEVRSDLEGHEIAATLFLVDAGEAIARSGSAEQIPAAAPTAGAYAIDADARGIVGAAPLDDDLPPWQLVIVEPLAHALAPARALTQRLALTTALALAAALLLATLSARRVVRPLTELTEAIRGMASGRSGAMSVPVRSDDEVGILARSFNQMADDLDDAQKHLVEAEKFAFVGELASGVAHEVRTSLGVLRSSAQMLGRSLSESPDPAIPELVGMVRDEVGRLGGVVDDLLTLDRPRAMHLEPTPLSQPLLRAAEFVAPQAREKGVAVRTERRGEDPIISGDREALQHVCVNLLVNALQAVGANGNVTLRIEQPRDGLASFRIEDDGPGIPEALRERIFEPFMTARDTGVGLGLTFVKRAINEHGGRIRATDSALGGACFEIQLPVFEGHGPDLPRESEASL